MTLLPHHMLLRARAGGLQRLISNTLVCAPAADLSWTQDVFGNLIAAATSMTTRRQLATTSISMVGQSATAWACSLNPTQGALISIESRRRREGRPRSALRGRTRGSGWDAKGLGISGCPRPLDGHALYPKSLHAGILNRVARRVRDEVGHERRSRRSPSLAAPAGILPR